MAHTDFLQAFAVSQGLDNAEQLTAGNQAQKYNYVTRSRDAAKPLVEALKARLPSGLDGVRVLHIGAGYGSLAIELAKHGASVVGVETADPKRTLAEIHAQGEADVTFLKSYLSVRSHVDVLREQGPFNVVIVHELFRRTYDTLGLLNNLKSLLAPGGLLSYRITNFFTPQAVLSDPVQKKLGLTLLPPDKIFDYVGGNYALYFRTKAYYDVLFDAVGFTDPQALNANIDVSYEATRRAIDTDLRRIRAALNGTNSDSSKIFTTIRAACREYLDEAATDLLNLSWDHLYEKYRAPYWEEIARIDADVVK